ncbi:MAG: branched-chain-amino-acid transaminase [Verrucomicrobiales bacterium]
MKIFLDGALVPKEEAKISVFDHGLLYGDGVFEGIRFYNDRVFRLPEHLARLQESARAIALSLPMPLAQIKEATLETIRANQLHDGYIRLVITRGVGGLGLSPHLCPKASIIIIADAIQLYPEEKYEHGLAVVTCSTQRMSPASLDPAIKSLNYLNNILAKMEAINAGAGEGLMLNADGFVAECTGDNVFIVKDGVIITPPPSAGALRGVTRAVVFELAEKLKLPVAEKMITRYDIFTADEFFLTGTAAEIIPAVTLDGRAIGSGHPGPISQKLIAAFRALTQSEGTPIYSS